MYRFAQYVSLQPNGCILWVGGLTAGGYGKFRTGRRGSRTVPAHRWIFEQIYGPIPNRLPLDHLCRTRNCVNVLHLEIVTHRQNVLRGVSPAATNAQKTHCIRGHALTGGNVWIAKNGSRHCRECQRLNLYPSQAEKRSHMRPPRIPGMCGRGLHPTTAENLYHNPRGYVECRPCRLERTAESKRRQAENVNLQDPARLLPHSFRGE